MTVQGAWFVCAHRSSMATNSVTRCVIQPCSTPSYATSGKLARYCVAMSKSWSRHVSMYRLAFRAQECTPTGMAGRERSRMSEVRTHRQ